jgi:hypothetical protein
MMFLKENKPHAVAGQKVIAKKGISNLPFASRHFKKAFKLGRGTPKSLFAPPSCQSK